MAGLIKKNLCTAGAFCYTFSYLRGLMNKYKILEYLLLPTLIVFILFLGVWLILFTFSFHMIEDEIEKKFTVELKQKIENIDINMEEVDKILQGTLTSRNFMKLRYIDDPFNDKIITTLIQTESTMVEASTANSFILDFFLFFFKGKLIISNKGIYPSHRFWEGAYHFIPFPDRIELETTKYNFKPLNSVVYTNYNLFPQKAIPYLHTFSSDGLPAGVIMVLCDLEYIENLFKPLVGEEGYLCIFDRQGVLIHSMGEMTDNRKNSLFKHTASYSHWQFELHIPRNNIYRGLSWMKFLQIVIILISVISCFLILFYFNSRRGNALYHIYNELHNEEDGPSKDLLSAIAIKVDSINNSEKKHIYYLKKTIMHNLLTGVPMADSELSELFATIGNKPEGDFFSILLLSFHSFDESILVILNNHLNETLWFYQTGIDQMAVVLSGSGSQEVWSKTNLAMTKKIRSESNQIAQMAIGSSVEKINTISQSYKQALMVMEYNSYHPHDQIIRYQDLPQISQSLYWPISVEQDLANLVLTCQTEELMNILETLYEKNKDQSGEIKQILLYSLKGTLLRVINQAFSEEDLRIQFSKRIEQKTENFDELKEELTSIMEDLKSKQHSRSEKIIRQIIDYILENYTLYDFGLSNITDNFPISEFHFSREFKKIQGQTFNRYVEDLRMKKARKLLKENRQSIKEIAPLCGYRSVGSFGRAFKKRHKLTPSAFQNSFIVK